MVMLCYTFQMTFSKDMAFSKRETDFVLLNKAAMTSLGLLCLAVEGLGDPQILESCLGGLQQQANAHKI